MRANAFMKFSPPFNVTLASDQIISQVFRYIKMRVAVIFFYFRQLSAIKSLSAWHKSQVIIQQHCEYIISFEEGVLINYIQIY